MAELEGSKGGETMVGIFMKEESIFNSNKMEINKKFFFKKKKPRVNSCNSCSSVWLKWLQSSGADNLKIRISKA